MLNPKLIKHGLPKVSAPELDTLIQGVRVGSIADISRAITLIESSNPRDVALRRKLIDTLHTSKNQSYRLGITGVPGVGKSTFIESFGLQAIDAGYKVAVLSIDPSSTKSGGSILGDKTRMNELSRHPMAYVRPTASGTHLGGVARSTRESIIICEAAGYDLIIVETVGVGQSEIEVLQLTDFFLLLMLAGAGDELQGIKRGIMESADAILITKADGNNVSQAKRAAQEYKKALHLMPPHEGNWIPKVATVSSMENTGMEIPLSWLKQYRNQTLENNYWWDKRAQQALYWFDEHVKSGFIHKLLIQDDLKKIHQQVRSSVKTLDKDPFIAVDEILMSFEIKLKS